MEVFGRKLPDFKAGKMPTACNTLLLKVPQVMYDLSLDDLVMILNSTPKQEGIASDKQSTKMLENTSRCVDFITRLVAKRVAALDTLEVVLAGQLAQMFARHDVRDVGFFEDLTARIAPKCIPIRDLESVRAVVEESGRYFNFDATEW